MKEIVITTLEDEWQQWELDEIELAVMQRSRYFDDPLLIEVRDVPNEESV